MARDQENDQPVSVGNIEKPARTIASRLSVYTIVVLLLLVLGMYGWKVFSVRSMEKEMELQRTEMIAQRQMALNLQAREMLQLTALPLTWALRTEIMRGNLSQVDDYFRDFVREDGVLSMFFIDKENMVALATNRKLETQPADGVVSQAIRDTERILIEQTESSLRLGAPVMSFNEKLGILVVDYLLPGSQAQE